MQKLLNYEIKMPNKVKGIKYISNKMKSVMYGLVCRSLTEKDINEIVFNCFGCNLSANDVKKLYNMIDNLFNEKSLK